MLYISVNIRLRMDGTEVTFRRSSRIRHWIRGFSIGFIISVVVSVLALLGHFRPYENPFTAVLQQVLGKKSQDLALVFITQDEYENGFKATSPLSRKRLARLIDVLAGLGARVIALDIDLSDATSQDPQFLAAVNRAAEKGIPVVIPSILSPKPSLPDSAQAYTALHPYLPETHEKTDKGDTLYQGTGLDTSLGRAVIHGGSVFTLDRDGVFRNARAFYHTDTGVIPAFPLALAGAYLGLSGPEITRALEGRHHHNIALGKEPAVNIHYGSKGKITPNFLGNYEHFERVIHVQALLDTYGSDTSSAGKTIFRDKAVLIGGVFDKNDFYPTPVGRMSGMEIIANTAQNIITGGLISHLSFWKAFGLEVLLGAVVALVFILLTPMRATLACLLLLMPVVVAVSLAAFSSALYWFDFIPTIAGVMLHGIISKIEENAHETA